MRAFLGTLVLVFTLLGIIAIHAHLAQDPRAQESRRALAGRLGWADLALSSDARWLRHPSLSEPAAALQDAPGALDLDPAGALISPPRAGATPGLRARIEDR